MSEVPSKHVVQKNETLVGIALKYDMKVDELKKMNKLFAGNTFEGQTLMVKWKKDGNRDSSDLSAMATQSLATPSAESCSTVMITEALPTKELGETNLPHDDAQATAVKVPGKLKLSTSVPNGINTLQGALTTQIHTSRDVTPQHKPKRSEVWGILGITNPNEVVNCYAKYIPIYGLQVTGVLTIAATRIIFEPNLDDPGVAKDGLLAHQFSVETGRILEVEIFLDAAMFRQRLEKQLEEQEPLDACLASADVKSDVKPEKNKKPKKARSSSKPLSVIHFDSTSEELLQIVCRGRYRPKNYANFILPKDKATAIYQRMILFLSGSKEERLKACLNLDMSTPPKHKPKLSRQHSFSTIRSTDTEYAVMIANLHSKRKLSRAAATPKDNKIKDVQVTTGAKAERKEAEANHLKPEDSEKDQEKKAQKDPASKRRGSFTDRWRNRKAADKSPRSSPPVSPTLSAVAQLPSALPPAIEINTEKPLDGDFVLIPPDEEIDIPVMHGQSLIFSEKHMHQLRRYLPGFNKYLDWQLLYCTQTHGISYSTFMHRTKNYSPTLIVVEDSNGFVFGGFATMPWSITTGYYGTGQSFLFSLKPKLHVYEWTRTNSYFMLMTPNAIAMGGDKDGRHGFWIDANFERGSSEMCATYFNRCLASTEQFACTILEVWTFTESKGIK